MKRFTLNLLATFLAFAAGLATATSWNSRRAANAELLTVNLRRNCPPPQVQMPVQTTPAVTVDSAPAEFVFGQGRLKLVPEQVLLKSESRRYDIDVKYPQISGEDNPFIQRVNDNLKQIATDKYKWPLNQSKEEIAVTREYHPGLFNTVTVTYEIGLATESFLSIHFLGYSVAAGAARSIQQSSTVNYDLTSGRLLKLSDIFKPGSKYLEILSLYCNDDLSRNTGRAPSAWAMTPRAENFETWHITSNGITFSFDSCRVFDCAEGDQTVEIPFTELKGVLSPGIPGKFKITYP